MHTYIPLAGGESSLSVYTMEVGAAATATTSAEEEEGDAEEGEVVARDSSIEWYDSFYPSIDDDDEDSGDDDGQGFVGCYVDALGDGRVMVADVAASDNMTVARCHAFCGGYGYFGVEYGEE